LKRNSFGLLKWAGSTTAARTWDFLCIVDVVGPQIKGAATRVTTLEELKRMKSSV